MNQTQESNCTNADLGLNSTMIVKLKKLASLRNLKFFVPIAIVCILFYYLKMPSTTSIENKREQEMRLCAKEARQYMRSQNEVKSNVNTRTRQHALLFLLDGPSESGKRILYMLQAARFKYHTQYGSIRNLPALIDNSKGRYASIIFEDAQIYNDLNNWNREMLDKYCVEYDVGVIMFVPSNYRKTSRNLYDEKLGNFPLSFSTNAEVQDYEVNPTSSILRIARAGKVIKEKLDPDWTIFSTNHNTYEPVSTVSVSSLEHVQRDKSESNHREKRSVRRKKEGSNVFNYQRILGFPSDHVNGLEPKCPTVLYDKGLFDNVKRVIFGSDLHFWMHKILFLDAMSFLSHGKMSLPLERYIQVDIDDIFVSSVGIRMKESDVMALVNFQTEMKSRIPNFHFVIGYSGKFIFKGTEEEQKGDKMFLKMKDEFLWFPHMWSHMQAHWFENQTKLCEYMVPNNEFAKRHGFNVSSGYAVAPHHAGIFPVHEPLYDCWKQIWGITTSSTEEYPNLRPDHKRKGFIYKGIKVLPRQTCGLFTHTNFREKYPGGPERLDSLIHGGTLFQSMLLNQYNIFMTHFSNYGSDRLALYVFDHAFDFIQCWTNLKLLQIPSEEMAERYFNDYPEEREPVWTNPCKDPRHLEIWSKDKSCEKLPKFIIAGPQKTGTTALQWFLLLHPDLKTSRSSPETFEEVQFFNGKNYLKGLDWYMDLFPLPNQEEVIFEKSANYFDSEFAPRQLSALLPKAHVVVLLVDPAKRAYSWYQHMKSHDDPTALQYSFYEVIKARKKGSPSPLLSLQSRCLLPGLYAEHLDRWNEYLPSNQIILEDGELLIKDPVTVLHRLQKSLSLPKAFNFTSALRFDEKKGFYCRVSDTGGTKCLGKGKGREYEEMTEKSQLLLKEYYKVSNSRLLQILKDRRLPVPQWLSSATVT